MNFRLIDSHCHLQLPAYDADRRDVISKLEADGIGAIVVGTNGLTSRLAVELAQKHANLWAAVAVHPGHAHDPHHDPNETIEPPSEEAFDPVLFSSFLKSPKTVAIGETGLDYYRLPDGEDIRQTIKRKQKDSFVAQIRFAKEYGLPLSLHVRDAHDDAWEILKAEKYFNGVMHCFTGTAAEAERYLSAGFYVSFTGAVTYPPRRNENENPLLAVVRTVPPERLLIETDAPWLSPLTRRGERNQPENVRYIAEKIAEIKAISYEKIAEQTVKNALDLFNLAANARP